MARIIDKNTRLIDVDFGPIALNILRAANSMDPDGTAGNIATVGGTGTDQILRFDADGFAAASFIQFERLDLNFMTMNNEVMQPLEVSVQRTCQTPFGSHQNGNNFDILQEFLLVTSRPLDNNGLISGTAPQVYNYFNQAGLNLGSAGFGGTGAGGLDQQQTIYAERRAYAFNSQTGALTTNGEVVPGQPTLNSFFSSPTLLELNTWGSLSAITGPNLYCYRVLFSRLQSFDADQSIFTNVGFGGLTTLTLPPVNIAFLCKDPNYSEGEYLTRLANAMNTIPVDGPTA